MTVQVRERADGLDVGLPSELRLVDEVLRAVRVRLPRRGLRPSSDLEIILRELLRNAIVHGNRRRATSRVDCRLRFAPSGPGPDRAATTCVVTVADEGGGFDFDSLDTSLPQPHQPIRNRGLVLVAALSRELRFEHNGSEITAVTSLAPALREQGPGRPMG